MPLPVSMDISIMAELAVTVQGRSAHSASISRPAAAPEALSSARVM